MSMTTVQTYLSVNYCDRLGLEIRALTISTDLELHGAELVHDVMQRLAYDAERDLVVALRRRLDRVTRLVVEAADVAQHAHRLVERTKPATPSNKQTLTQHVYVAVKKCNQRIHVIAARE